MCVTDVPNLSTHLETPHDPHGMNLTGEATALLKGKSKKSKKSKKDKSKKSKPKETKEKKQKRLAKEQAKLEKEKEREEQKAVKELFSKAKKAGKHICTHACIMVDLNLFRYVIYYIHACYQASIHLPTKNQLHMCLNRFY